VCAMFLVPYPIRGAVLDSRLPPDTHRREMGDVPVRMYTHHTPLQILAQAKTCALVTLLKSSGTSQPRYKYWHYTPLDTEKIIVQHSLLLSYVKAKHQGSAKEVMLS
jgi:hypothetical protein